MMTILAGILSLGNTMFQPTDTDSVKVTDKSMGWLKATAVSHALQFSVSLAFLGWLGYQGCLVGLSWYVLWVGGG